MPTSQHPDPAAKTRSVAVTSRDGRDDRHDDKRDKDAREEEALRDQSRTEVEERPYLDTEGSD